MELNGKVEIPSTEGSLGNAERKISATTTPSLSTRT